MGLSVLKPHINRGHLLLQRENQVTIGQPSSIGQLRTIDSHRVRVTKRVKSLKEHLAGKLVENIELCVHYPTISTLVLSRQPS